MRETLKGTEKEWDRNIERDRGRERNKGKREREGGRWMSAAPQK